jgi:hypothetical protein
MKDFLRLDATHSNYFRKNYSKKIFLGNSGLNLFESAANVVIHANWKNFVPQLIVQTAHQCHVEALLYCTRREPNLALAMARIGIENIRDLFRILEDESRSELWLSHPDKREEDIARRKVFRFNLNNDVENSLWLLYNTYSKFGIHNRLKFTGGPSRVVSNNGTNYVVLQSDWKDCEKIFMLILSGIMLAMPLIIDYAYPAIEKSSPECFQLGRIWTDEFLVKNEEFNRYYSVFREAEDRQESG